MSEPETNTKRPVGRPSVAAERREQILDAVADCVIEVGFADTTLEAIATRAGMTRSAIAHFIGNKDDVIAAAVTASVDRFVTEAHHEIDHIPPDQQLESFVDYVLQADRDHANALVVIMDEVIAHAHHDDHARHQLRSGYNRLHSFVEQMVAHRFPESTATRQATVATGLILVLREFDRVRSLDATDEPGRMRHQVRDVVDTLLESMAT